MSTKLSKLQDDQKRRIETLQQVVDLQCQPGNWDYDSYNRGFANGLMLALSAMTGLGYEPLLEPERYTSGEVTKRALREAEDSLE